MTIHRTALPLLALAALAGFLLGTPAFGEDVVLKHDDGTMEAKRSIAGGGHAVAFETPKAGTWFVTAVELFGARYGMPSPPDEDFFIYVLDGALKKYCKIARPYGRFERGEEGWVKIEIPPVKVPKEFLVCFVFNPGRTKGVFVGVDTAEGERRSRQGTPEGGFEEFAEGNWMIRPHLTDKVKGVPVTLATKEEWDKEARARAEDLEKALLRGGTAKLLSHDGGEMDDHQSMGGSGAQTVHFRAPQGGGIVFKVLVYGSQYGMDHDPEAVLADVYILDGERKVLTRTSVPYSRFDFDKKWVELDVLPTRVEGDFYVAFHAHSERTKGLYVGHGGDKGAGESSFTGVSRKGFEPLEMKAPGAWMIRVKTTSKPYFHDAASREE